jgi:hypothetical protein
LASESAALAAAGRRASASSSARLRRSARPTAGIYLPSDKAAITLGKVVILENSLYDALVASSNAAITGPDLIASSLDFDFVFGVTTLLHELTHVKQYRVDGDTNFIANYVIGTLANGGYGNDAYEKKAYKVAASLTDLWGGRWCNATESFHDDKITSLSLGIPLLTCN